jgi:hypothetical protein
MFSVMILAIAVAALAQFGAFYWRALVVCTAAESVSEEVLAAAQVQAGTIRGEDYRSLAQLHRLTPELCAQSSGLGLVPAYFKVMQAVKALAVGRAAALADWAEGESVLCARYAAVQVERRLRANLEFGDSMRSC